LGRQPQETAVVLANVGDGNCDAVWIETSDAMVSKGFCYWIEAVQGLIGSNPERTGPISKQRIDINAAQTLFVPWIMLEYFKLVAIVAV
jgi:hypothetical protein